jgi:hypothetical protein
MRCVQECLAHIIAALDHHPGEVDIQTKGLVLLGVLIQVGRLMFWICRQEVVLAA